MLQKEIEPYIISRDLPLDALKGKDEYVVFVELSAEQRRLYQSVLQSSLQRADVADFVSGKTNKQLGAFAAIMKFRKVCCHPALVQEESQAGLDVMNRLLKQCPKLRMTLDLILQIKQKGERTLLFSQLTS